MSGLIAARISEYLSDVRPRTFFSYHHHGDQVFYDLSSLYFGDTVKTIHDASLDRRIDSDDTDYVRWCIRDECIRGSSCTVVLCGAQTPWRKYVDWEISATLDMYHGLVGIGLPTVQYDFLGRKIVPDRLNDNLQSGYAVWLPDWNAVTTQSLDAAIKEARARAEAQWFLINNGRELRKRNG
jgi:hypothetical protein